MQAEPVKWERWLPSGADDMAKLVDEQLHEVADFEVNLKALKVCCYLTYDIAKVHSHAL